MPATDPDSPRLSVDKFYAPGIEWAHGGPAELDGGQLRRYGKSGGDSGGIFLTRSDPGQMRYAAGYSRGGLYRVMVDLQPDEVFNLDNPEHCDRVAPIETNDGIGRDFLESAFSSGNTIGALDWAVVDEEVLLAAGFRGAILAERPPGVMGDEPIYSLAVFDPKAVRVIGKHSKATLERLRKETMRFIEERHQQKLDHAHEADSRFPAPLTAPVTPSSRRGRAVPTHDLD